MDLEINFCNDCHNLTYLHLNEGNELIHYCSFCDKETEIKSDGQCIYKQSFSDIDVSELINHNKYINQDKTLPTITNNSSEL